MVPPIFRDQQQDSKEEEKAHKGASLRKFRIYHSIYYFKLYYFFTLFTSGLRIRTRVFWSDRESRSGFEIGLDPDHIFKNWLEPDQV